MWLLLAFITLLLGWSMLIWLALPIAIVDRSLGAIALLHIAPPIIPLIVWYLASQYRQHIVARRLGLQEREEQNLRETDRAKAFERHQRQLSERRSYIDIRWAGIGDGYLRSDDPLIAQESAHTITVNSTNNARRSNDRWPQRPLSLLLESLFRQCPLATTLPILLARPANPAIHDFQSHGLSARHAALRQTSKSASAAAEIIILEDGAESAHTEISELFVNHPDWVGAVLIAFDHGGKHNPLTELTHDADDGKEEESPRQKWRGIPNAGISVLLFTPSTLSLVLSQLNDDSHIDQLTPFWEKERIRSKHALAVAGLPFEVRNNIPPPQSSLHNIRSHKLDPGASSLELAIAARQLVVDAAIDASLIEPSFELDGEDTTDARSSCQQPITDTWLVHNSGDISCGGERLAQLSLALYQSSVEIHPIDSAMNAVTTFGDCGAATGWLQLARAAQQTSTKDKLAVFAHFLEDKLALCFLIPASWRESKPSL